MKKQEIYSDESYMLKVKQGDLNMLVPLFQRYQKRLYNFFLNLSNDENISQDLVQNVFVRIMKYRESYNDQFKFKTWMYQMARHLYYDHYKANTKIQNQFVSVEAIRDADNSESEMVKQQEMEHQLMTALQKLPNEKREILVMSKFQRMPYEEIAEITDSSVANVKVKVHRAIKSLREVYFKIQ